MKTFHPISLILVTLILTSFHYEEDDILRLQRSPFLAGNCDNPKRKREKRRDKKKKGGGGARESEEMSTNGTTCLLNCSTIVITRGAKLSDDVCSLARFSTLDTTD